MADPIQLLRQLYKNATDRDDARSQQTQTLPPHMVAPGEGLPRVSRPPMFRPQTEIRGGSEFANTVEDFFDKVPDMRGRTPSITHGPNEGVFRELKRSGLEIDDYGRTNLLGATSIQNRAVSLNPRLKPITPGALESIESTLAHELGHVADLPHGPEIKSMQYLIEGGDPRAVEPIVEDLPAINNEEIIGVPKRSLPEPAAREAMLPDVAEKFMSLVEAFKRRR